MRNRAYGRGWWLVTLTLALGAILAGATPSRADDQIYFSSNTDVTSILVQYINQETVRLDISSWYLSEHSISIAIANRFAAGVPVRIIGDRASLFENDPHTKAEFYWLANQGIPIRLRENPTYFPEIDHWKAAIFVGQNVVEFGSGNFAPTELRPVSSTNYDDDSELFTSDPELVNAFKTKFDVMWHDTAVEPESIYSGPPYLLDWNAACAVEQTGNCRDYPTLYPNPAPMTIDTTRLEPDYPMPADLIWGQGPDFNNRLTQEIANGGNRVDLLVYRLTVDNITQALINKFQGGTPVRIIIDAHQYLNSVWPEFELTHANIDKLWAAGIPIKQNVHDGVMHMKTLVTSSYATNASSNYAAAWQRDQDYFVSAAAKPTIYQALADRVQAMWNDTTGFTTFSPGPPAAAALSSPSSGTSGTSQTPTLVWNRAAFAVSFDVYLGTSSSSMSLVANVPARMVNNPPPTYSWTAPSALAGGTTYFWKIVSRTNATAINPALSATSPTWSFTTGGSGGGGGGTLPSPWVSQDVGSTGQAGSASFSNGVFTVNGAGASIWGSADSFQYVDQPATGDVTVVARITSLQNTGTFAKAGIMLRDSLAANAANVVLDIRPTGDFEFMTRASDGASESFIATANLPLPAWVRLARSGSTVTASISSNGTNWTAIGTTSFGATNALAGLIVCSSSTGTLNTSAFDNASVTSGGGGGGGGSLPSPWASQDIGATGQTGSASATSGVFTVHGAGTSIWGSADSFQYVNQPASGDVTVVARITSLQNTGTFAKAGIMLRDSSASNGANVTLDIRPTGDFEFMTRASDGASESFVATANLPLPAWVRLARSGSTVTASVSSNGSNWTTIGSASFAAPNALAGLIVCSSSTGTLNTSTFDNVSVTAGGGGGGGGGGSAPDIVVYASDVPSGGVHGQWGLVSDASSPNSVKLATPAGGNAITANALATPADYVDVPFTATAGTPYTLWVRLEGTTNTKASDSAWVQFSDAQLNGTNTSAYPINSTAGLLLNLATDSSGSSVHGFGWVNGAYWLTQQATVTFPTTGTHTIRIQVREYGVAFDQVVLSPTTYFNPSASCPNSCSGAPGPVDNDMTIVPKP
jgi:regulation of enolase protein 1 (concanavalin A-like superfamily)